MVEFEFATSGVDIHPRCLTHSCEVLTSKEPHFHGETAMKSTWHVRGDISAAMPGSDFLFITDATFWNAFTGDSQEWASISASQQTEEIGIIVLFPENKPYKTITVKEGKHKTREMKPYEGTATTLSKDNNHVYMWTLRNPKPGQSYQFGWTW